MDDETLVFVLNIIGNCIFIPTMLPPLLHQGLTKKFSYELEGAYYIKQNNPSANTIVRFWNEKRRTLPLTMKDGLVKTLQDYAVHVGKKLVIDIIDRRTFNPEKIIMPDKMANIVLRDYQNEAVDKIQNNKIGIIRIGCGGGKGDIGSEVIRRLNCQTLFIVNRIDLLLQMKQRMEKELGIKVGVIQGDNIDIQFVTIAMIQTLSSKKKQLFDYLSTVRCMIIDECHNAASRSYLSISRCLKNCEYHIGLSATPFRVDGKDMNIAAVCGYVVFEMNADELIKRNLLMEPQVVFIKYDEPKVKTENKVHYSEHYNLKIVHNDNRNNIICQLAEKHKDLQTLILVKTIEHGNYLSNKLGAKYICGSMDLKEREQLIVDFTDKKVKMIIATLSIFQQGLNIPSLEIIINAAANKSDISSIQSLGRLLRMASGKHGCIYYDFYDKSFLFLRTSKKRIDAFKDEGHDINFVEA